jgi:hypothetical protein
MSCISIALFACVPWFDIVFLLLDLAGAGILQVTVPYHNRLHRSLGCRPCGSSHSEALLLVV